MLWLGIDDTDTLDTPGTNKLALHVANLLSDELSVEIIVRHQLFFDPRVPYTSHNGCVSLRINAPASLGPAELADRLRPIIVDWCPAGSDPGLCITGNVPGTISEFALRCQTAVVTRREAFDLASMHGLHLESLGGTGDGVIGALAAVGLLATQNDGRIIHHGNRRPHWSDITGVQSAAHLLECGVAEIRCLESDRRVTHGTVALAKRLRPNLRAGRAVLFVEPSSSEAAPVSDWQAVKVV